MYVSSVSSFLVWHKYKEVNLYSTRSDPLPLVGDQRRSSSEDRNLPCLFEFTDTILKAKREGTVSRVLRIG